MIRFSRMGSNLITAGQDSKGNLELQYIRYDGTGAGGGRLIFSNMHCCRSIEVYLAKRLWYREKKYRGFKVHGSWWCFKLLSISEFWSTGVLELWLKV